MCPVQLFLGVVGMEGRANTYRVLAVPEGLCHARDLQVTTSVHIFQLERRPLSRHTVSHPLSAGLKDPKALDTRDPAEVATSPHPSPTPPLPCQGPSWYPPPSARALLPSF